MTRITHAVDSGGHPNDRRYPICGAETTPLTFVMLPPSRQFALSRQRAAFRSRINCPDCRRILDTPEPDSDHVVMTKDRDIEITTRGSSPEDALRHYVAALPPDTPSHWAGARSEDWREFVRGLVIPGSETRAVYWCDEPRLETLR